MGSQKVKERRVGVSRPGPQQRRALAVNVEQTRVLKCAAQNTRKARSRALFAEIEDDHAESLPRLTEEERNERDIMRDVEDFMTTREENRLATIIVECIL